MKKRTILWLTISILILAVTLISACTKTTPTPSPTPIPTPAPTPSASVTGTVTYLEKIALPPNAIINVKLQDISKADAPAVTIGELSITASGKQVPFNFEIMYDPATIDPRFTYAVRGTITIDGQLTFTSDKAYLVITRGNPNSAEIILKKVSSPTLGQTLENTAWVLQSYGQPGNLKSVLKDTEVTALFDSAKGQVAGSAGVNRYFGAYRLDANKLIIPGPIGSTAMAGPQPLMDQEKEYLWFYLHLVGIDLIGVKLMKTLRRFIGWLKQRQNDGYRLPETKRAELMLLRKLHTKYICSCCHHYPEIASKCPFQPTLQHQERETTRKKHVRDLEY